MLTVTYICMSELKHELASGLEFPLFPVMSVHFYLCSTKSQQQLRRGKTRR